MADKGKLLKLAQKHLSKGNLDKAIKTFQQLVEVDPRDQRLILRLADIQARAGRKKEAIENYEKVAAGYMKQDFTPKAIAVYKTILRLDPELLSTYEKLAGLYKSQGLEAEALSQFENLFQVYERKNDEDKQIEVLKLMADMDPENLGFQVRLGETLAKKGRKKEAAEAFAKAASTLSRRGFHDRASQLFEKITALNPDNTAVRRELCAHYLESGQYNEARVEIEAILALEPDDPRMVLLLGRILFQLGSKAEGEEKIAQSIRLFLDAGELESVMREFLFVAQAHLRNGEVDEAEAFYRQIMENAPGEVRAIKGLVSVAETRKDRVGQINHLLVLARTMDQNGDRAGAANAYGKVSDLDPLNEEARDFLAGGGPAQPMEQSQVAADSPEEVELLDSDMEEIEELDEVEEIEEIELLEAGDADLGDVSPDQGLGEVEEEIEILDMERPEEVDLGEDKVPVLFLVEEAEGTIPDIILEDYEEDDLLLEGPVDADEQLQPLDPVAAETPEISDEKPAEMSLEELLAEADVYERYGLAEKAGEALQRAKALAPEDKRVVDRLAAFESGIPSVVSPSPGGPAEPGTQPPPESATVPVPEPDPFQEDLEEADFYHSQGLDDEALRIYRSVVQRDPHHQRAAEAIASIEGGSAAPATSQPFPATDAMPGMAESTEPPAAVEAPPEPIAGSVLETQFDPGSARELRSKLIVTDATSEDMGDFLDIADELRSELAEDMDIQSAPADADGPVSFEDIFSQFKKGIEETLGDEEYETHYNLGIAYKDMGLYDDAIREFESGSRDPALAQDSYSLMAMCYVEKKDYESAVQAIEQALKLSTDDTRTGLYYQLGEVREKQKQWPEAVSAYEQVQSGDPGFEGITEAIQRARSSLEDDVLGVKQEEPSAETGMDDMLADLIKEVEEMAKESSGDTKDDPGRSKKDRISYL